MNKTTVEEGSTPPRWFGLVALLCGLPFFIIGIALGHADKGITATLSVAILIVVVRMYWRDRHRIWFWSALGLAMALNITAVGVVHFSKLGQPAIAVFGPLGIGDFLAMVLLFTATRKVAETAGQKSRLNS